MKRVFATRTKHDAPAAPSRLPAQLDFLHRSESLSVSMRICISMYLFLSVSAYLGFCVSVRPRICAFAYLWICVSVYPCAG